MKLLTVGAVVFLLLAWVPSAFANPESAPGAGDSTDTANERTVEAFGDGSDVPGPFGEGVNNNPNFDSDHASFHSVTNNPACVGHTGHD